MGVEEIRSSGEEFESLKDDLRLLRADMTDLVRALGSEGGGKMAELRDRV